MVVRTKTILEMLIVIYFKVQVFLIVSQTLFSFVLSLVQITLCGHKLILISKRDKCEKRS